MTEETFLDMWAKARMHYDKLPTHITRLNFREKTFFRDLTKDYGKGEFAEAMNGLFFQKTVKAIRVRPAWFLENFETMRDCWLNKTKLYE